MFITGTHNIDSLTKLDGDEIFYTASEIIMHEDFDMSNMANDIALVHSN